MATGELTANREGTGGTCYFVNVFVCEFWNGLCLYILLVGACVFDPTLCRARLGLIGARGISCNVMVGGVGEFGFFFVGFGTG